MNGRSACLLRFWPVLFRTLPSKCISLGWEPFISNKVLRILFTTVFACRVSYMASNALRAPPASSRLPITDDLMLVIWKSLNLQLPDHCMFWAASTLGYFGFLRSAEFTVPSLASFSPSIHLGVQDIAVDSSTAPSCIRVTIKASTTDPFRKGCSIHIGLGKYPLCASIPYAYPLCIPYVHKHLYQDWRQCFLKWPIFRWAFALLFCILLCIFFCFLFFCSV